MTAASTPTNQTVINGYQWISQHKGVHTFSKRAEDGIRYAVIYCETEQLTNGDIEFMTAHDLTISEERKRKAYKSF